jgi:hypothetical protein
MRSCTGSIMKTLNQNIGTAGMHDTVSPPDVQTSRAACSKEVRMHRIPVGNRAGRLLHGVSWALAWLRFDWIAR